MENGWLCILYQDNGKGYQPENSNRPTGAGIKNIESRTLALGGTLTISTAPGKGFEAKIDLPIKQITYAKN
jgi:signal transduction histidine kinase